VWRQITVIGKTFSGHATRTTVGNTWRCYQRLLMVFSAANIPE